MSDEITEFGTMKIHKSVGVKPGDVWMGPSMSPRLMEAFARGEVTLGGLAEAGWRIVGKLKEDDDQ